MRTYHGALLLWTAAFGLMLFCGCGRKRNTFSTQVPLIIGIASTLNYVSYVRASGPFINSCSITTQSGVAQQEGGRAPANVVWVFHYNGGNIEEAGVFYTNTKMYVNDTLIWGEWHQTEDADVIGYGCAAVATHEIGHYFLGGNEAHVTDPTPEQANVMHCGLEDLLPILRRGWYPLFNPAQKAIIRKKLGYTD